MGAHVVAARSPEDARPISVGRLQRALIEVAKDAYVYGFPLVDFYRIYAAFFLFPHSPVYKGAVDTLINPTAPIIDGSWKQPPLQPV